MPGDHLLQDKPSLHVPMARLLGDAFLQRLGPALASNHRLRECFDFGARQQLAQAQRQGGDHSEQLWGVMQLASLTPPNGGPHRDRPLADSQHGAGREE
jgi:hypothetical protein